MLKSLPQSITCTDNISVLLTTLLAALSFKCTEPFKPTFSIGTHPCVEANFARFTALFWVAVCARACAMRYCFWISTAVNSIDTLRHRFQMRRIDARRILTLPVIDNNVVRWPAKLLSVSTSVRGCFAFLDRVVCRAVTTFGFAAWPRPARICSILLSKQLKLLVETHGSILATLPKPSTLIYGWKYA